MAEFKISELTEATTLADADLLETSVDAGAGTYTSKKIRFDNFKTAAAPTFTGWGYQDFAAGTITGTSVTITDNENGTVVFDNTKIVNGSGIICIEATPEKKPYTGSIRLFSTMVTVSTSTGPTVTLTGIPHTSWGNLRVYYYYTYEGGMPEGYTIPSKAVSAAFINELDAIFVTDEEALLVNEYDYYVTAGSWADLVTALESGTYATVFIPDGTYTCTDNEANPLVVHADVKRISGESRSGVILDANCPTNNLIQDFISNISVVAAMAITPENEDNPSDLYG